MMLCNEFPSGTVGSGELLSWVRSGHGDRQVLIARRISAANGRDLAIVPHSQSVRYCGVAKRPTGKAGRDTSSALRLVVELNSDGHPYRYA